MSDDASFELLGFQVIQGEQVVTYRKLSSDLQVHAEDAKRMMAAFYEANKERCHATFLLSGTRKRDMVDESVEAEWLVKLVTESELPSQQLNLEYAEYHIYSIEPRPVEDKSVFVTANISTGNIRDMIHLGAIGSSVAMVAKTGTASIPRAPSPVRPPTSKSENKSHSTKANDESRMDEDASMAGSNTDANAPAVSKAADKAPDKTSSKAKANPAKSFFGKHIAKKSAAVTTSSEATAAPSDEITSVKAEVSTASSLEPESKPDPVPPMSDSDDHAMQSAEEEIETAVKQSRVEDMFDDFDDSDFDSFAKSAASDASQEGLESDIEMAEPTAVTNDNAHPELQNVGGGRRRVRKQRKVNRIKHTKNKRGMLVTQAVEEWESYSESESDAEPTKPKPNPKPKPSMSADEPASKKKSSAGGSKGSGAPQRSILSFFGKKN
ncbi:CDC27 protein [Coemansia interrupta]|uniref:DNA polymerase delta subunit 3 n=1 Tax=Coemansia interrupta TaxID=1126814 RepID=A0A9W8H4C7_9FUNG|nr:CDC27 protein [Coemansia interrupta]